VTSLSATSGCFRNWMTPTFVSKGRKYSRIIRPHHFPPTDNRQKPRRPVSASKRSRAPGANQRGSAGGQCGRRLLDRLPVAGDIAGVEVEAHRQAVLARRARVSEPLLTATPIGG
jgi:hypothetical protein